MEPGKYIQLTPTRLNLQVANLYHLERWWIVGKSKRTVVGGELAQRQNDDCRIGARHAGRRIDIQSG